MMRLLGLSLLFMVCFSACSPRIGIGVGVGGVAGDGVAASQVIADSETGIHGSVTTGADIRL